MRLALLATPLALLAACDPPRGDGASGGVDMDLADSDASECVSEATVTAVKDSLFARARARGADNAEALDALAQRATVRIGGSETVAEGICAGELALSVPAESAPGLGGESRLVERIEYRPSGEPGRAIVEGGEGVIDRLASFNPRARPPEPTPTPDNAAVADENAAEPAPTDELIELKTPAGRDALLETPPPVDEEPQE